MRIGVPAYFDPLLEPGAWRRLCDAAPTVGLVVANPHNGPGARRLEAYVAAIEQARRVGITVLGYVHASYGRRTLVDVCADVERWYAWYGVQAIFVDEIGSSTEHEPYNAALSASIRARQAGGPGDMLVFNPGMDTSPDVLAQCDVVLNWEGSWPSYRAATWQPPAPAGFPPAERVWHVVHGCPTRDALQAAVRLAAARRVAWLYVTPGSGANPYRGLPPTRYWLDEVDAVTRSVSPVNLFGM